MMDVREGAVSTCIPDVEKEVFLRCAGTVTWVRSISNLWRVINRAPKERGGEATIMLIRVIRADDHSPPLRPPSPKVT